MSRTVPIIESERREGDFFFPGDTPLKRTIYAARRNYEDGANCAAHVLYTMILDQTPLPCKSGTERVAHGEACVFMAKVALAKQRLGEAADWYREALDADPRASEYRADYIRLILLRMGMQDAALAEARMATRIDPTEWICWRVLAEALHHKGEGHAALAAHEKALELAPNNALPYLDVACIALDLADYDRVRAMLAIVMERWPHRRADATNLLAMVAFREGRHEDAVVLYDEAIAGDCQDVHMSRWNQGIALHSIGRYKEGWAAFEGRHTQISDPLFRIAAHRFERPLWQGEPAPLRLHLHAEMGYGDQLALVRYAPALVAQGYDVRLEVPASLVNLLQFSMPTVNVIEKALDYPRAMGIPDFDYHCPMQSLPTVMGTDIDTVPWSGPYLKADPENVWAWIDRQPDASFASHIETLPGGHKRRIGHPWIGLCWSSGIRDGLWLKEYGRRKSMSFEQLAPLFSHTAQFFSLQCGPAADENLILPGLDREDGDWAETAALIECLDLVITVDSAVAHLAGAMGKPVWVMMHTEGSWHWMTARAWGGRCATESPWYPSARLFRQERPHEWGDVINDIGAALRKGI